jgi:predicted enzyme involved in methoxymalonyl-ACP biosynthesis
LFYQDLLPGGAKSFEEGVSRLSLLLSLVKSRLEFSTAETVVCLSHFDVTSPIERARSQAVDDQVCEWFKTELFQLVAESRSGYFIDLVREFSYVGYERVFDKRNWYLAHCHLSSEGLEILIDRVSAVTHRIYRPAKKF